MARHTSNADRIARAAAEAEATAKEKATTVKAPRKRASRAKRAPAAGGRIKGRVKIIWAVGKPGLEPVKTYPYKEKEAADAEAVRRGEEFRSMPLKVPME